MESRGDELIVRLVVSVAIVVSVIAEWHGGTPLWRLVVGTVASAVTVAALLVQSSRLSVDRRQMALVIVVATTVLGLAFSTDATLWIVYIGVGAAARFGLWTGYDSLLLDTLVVTPPMVALAVHSWWLAHGVWSTAFYLGVGVVVIGFVVVRRRQRDAAELAAAQSMVIEQERARAHVEHLQREVAAQIHDVLAHTLSGLIVTLQGAAVAAERDGASADVTARLDTAIGLARDGLAGARDAVETLTDSRAADTSTEQPLTQWTHDTIEQFTTVAGLDVTIVGTPESVPASWDRLTRSLIMEGLTNSMKHAAGAPVRLEFTPEAVGIVSLGDPASFVDLGHRSGGHGLAGLRERVEHHGGRLEYGPSAQGFVVTMRMSLR
ncbi:histidine kinase [Gordonia jinhuaensis]|uniref:histidine kinase n=1 Tax=Gordonia jinhuaensis TaxID=1517702 RepID=A0A916TIY6_9ACTN|nr:histidine kinase [Gordonia jinhuaensis]GGB47513.1 two-component sensor histidine kinase [Gordonia jinhuaensis]